MGTQRVSAIRALVRSFSTHPGGGGAWFMLGMMLLVGGALAAYLLLDERTHRIDRLTRLLAMLTWFLGMGSLTLVSHLHVKRRAHLEPLLRVDARAEDAGTVLSYSAHDWLPPEPPDAAVCAVPGVMAVGCSLLGFSAAMSLVAGWTAPAFLQNRWEGTFWLGLIAFMLVTSAWRITAHIRDVYQWGVEQQAAARRT